MNEDDTSNAIAVRMPGMLIALAPLMGVFGEYRVTVGFSVRF